jgi:aspartate aminotransferase
MKDALSKSVLALDESPLYSFYRRVKALESKGIEVISLGIGEPDSETPDTIKNAGIQAIKTGKTRYVPSNGSADIRSMLADNYGVAPEEVVISHGAKTVLSAVLHSLVDPEDRVLMAAPYYPPFVGVVKSLGGWPLLVDTKKNGFQLTVELIRKALACKKNVPKILVLNTPNNPTGVEYSRDELEKIASWADENDVIVIADECYSCFSSDPNFSFRQLLPEAIIIDTVSKGYAMPGWRIGWGVMPVELANMVKLYLDNHIGCPGSINERAAFIALGHEFINPYNEQRELLSAWLKKYNIPFEPTNGGIYLFPDFSSIAEKIGGSEKLAEKFLKNGVALTPGIAFGKYDNHLRISYCVPVDKLEKAIRKMKETLGQL